MSFQVRSLFLYNKEGDLRILPFRLGGVNIITGQSSTGKSAILEIIDYCLGRSAFAIPEGAIRETVVWYGLVVSLSGTEVLIAKPAPVANALSQSRAYIEVGSDLPIPPMSGLEPNTTDEGVIETLTSLSGISNNENVPSLGQTRPALQATVRHASYYLFQNQGLVASRETLFYRQSEPYLAQAIKDTLPYFLGAVREDRVRLRQELREAKRALRAAQQTAQETANIVDDRYTRGKSLLAEAEQVGLISGTEYNSLEKTDLLKILRDTTAWTPRKALDVPGDRTQEVRGELQSLRRDYQIILDQVAASEAFAKESQGYSNEARHQLARLMPIGLFEGVADKLSCPLCASSLEAQLPDVTAVRSRLAALSHSLETVSREAPRLDTYIGGLKAQATELNRKVADKQRELEALINEQSAAVVLQDTNSRAARVVGRISLFLDSVRDVDRKPSTDPVVTAERNVARLEALLAEEDEDDLLQSILNRIGVQMTAWAKLLRLEHNPWPFRLDIKNLTVVADRPGRPIPMNRMGGGENWLGCHLVALLALHHHFATENRPVPHFLILDQPTQVYFPSPIAYRSLRGLEEDTVAANADITAVSRMFNLLFDVTELLSGGFQIIVTEHANLPDLRFQAALVEGPWTDGRALIPPEWLISSG